MSRLKKVLIRLLLSFGCVCVVVFLIVVLLVAWKGMKAERVINEVRIEQWSSVNFEKAREITERFGGHPGVFGRQSASCSASGCRFDIAVTNSPLDYFHLAPKTGFYVSIHLQDNRVTAVSSDLLSTVIGGSAHEVAPLGAAVIEDIVQSDPTVPGFRSTLSSDSVSGASTINVALNLSATPEERQAAYEFNLGCLTRFKGCKKAEDFLPRVAGMLSR